MLVIIPATTSGRRGGPLWLDQGDASTWEVVVLDVDDQQRRHTLINISGQSSAGVDQDLGGTL
jgi:hypothetical protein